MESAAADVLTTCCRIAWLNPQRGAGVSRTAHQMVLCTIRALAHTLRLAEHHAWSIVPEVQYAVQLAQLSVQQAVIQCPTHVGTLCDH